MKSHIFLSNARLDRFLLGVARRFPYGGLPLAVVGAVFIYGFVGFLFYAGLFLLAWFCIELVVWLVYLYQCNDGRGTR